MRRLRELSLVGLRLSDASLAFLRGCAAIQDLNLAEAGITDAGLEHLADTDQP